MAKAQDDKTRVAHFNLINSAIHSLETVFRDTVSTPLRDETGVIPSTIHEFARRLKDARRGAEDFYRENPEVSILDGLRLGDRRLDLPAIHVSLVRQRRKTAIWVSERKAKVSDPQMAATLDSRVQDLDGLIQEVADHQRLRVPTLSDHMTIRHSERALGIPVQLTERVADEKFGILLAPQLFEPDLAQLRRRCELRGVDLIACFVDIDDFKAYNSDHGHETVDRCLLPHFMQCLEASVFSHGHAYRQGGDEYLILLPNMGVEIGKLFLRGMLERVSVAQYPNGLPAPTLSVGAYVVQPQCPLTDAEIREKANQICTGYAKDGKNRAVIVAPQREPIVVEGPTKTS